MFLRTLCSTRILLTVTYKCYPFEKIAHLGLDLVQSHDLCVVAPTVVNCTRAGWGWSCMPSPDRRHECQCCRPSRRRTRTACTAPRAWRPPTARDGTRCSTSIRAQVSLGCHQQPHVLAFTVPSGTPSLTASGRAHANLRFRSMSAALLQCDACAVRESALIVKIERDTDAKTCVCPAVAAQHPAVRALRQAEVLRRTPGRPQVDAQDAGAPAFAAPECTIDHQHSVSVTISYTSEGGNSMQTGYDSSYPVPS